MMQFILFLINGGVIGVLTFVSQTYLDLLMQNYTTNHQMISSILTILPFIIINFNSQKRIIFKRKGNIAKFFIAHISIMFLVTFLNVALNKYSIFNFEYMAHVLNLNFIFAAIFIAPLSFLIQKKIVFYK
jgi:hypothetical protein